MQAKQGSISVNGQTFDDNPTSYRNQMAYIPEMPILYDELTLYEHLRLTAMAYDIPEDVFEQRLQPLLKEFHLERQLHWFPVHFSKGMRQKVMIMCAFLIERRSEEHTSELQSRLDIVCRILLEKKKKNTIMC